MAPKDKITPISKAASPAAEVKDGDRIAKVLSRRGVASRRDAERLIEAGEVTVNGKVITSPALNVTPADRITISGHPLPAEEAARLWLYYKPEGLVTSTADEKGRDTVFDHLPETMPRVMAVGRLDLNSEGLLLLTNDGELKRRLELPSTGWLRKYRVRVNGTVNDPRLQPLRDGITVEGETFRPMQVTIDRQQGSNAWLTVGLREGKNREIRRAMNEIGLYVNRLIRVSYGPFRLGDLEPGQAEEVKARVLRDQLGEIEAEAAEAESTRPARPGAAGRPAAAKRVAPGSRSPAPTPNRIPASGTFRGNRRAPRAEDETVDDLRLSKPVRPGDGVAALSSAWKEATTPRNEDKPRRPRSADAAAPRGEKPASPRGSAAKPAIGKAPYGKAPYGKDPAGRDSDARPAGKTFASRGAKPGFAKASGFSKASGEDPTKPSRSFAGKPRSGAGTKPGGAPRSGGTSAAKPRTPGLKRPPRSRD